MLGDELHDILYHSSPKLIVKWAQMFAHFHSYYEDNTGQRMQVVLDGANNIDEGLHFASNCGFIKYLFLESEVDAITKSLKRFLNLKAFL
jgi:hypothetical protein